MTRLALIHTVGTLAPVFGKLADELIPAVERMEIVDEALLSETIAAGGIPDATAERLEGHVDRAIAGGADLVLVTCSSVGPAVEAIYDRRGLPLLRVDEALADRAHELGSRIGVIATLSTTLEPTADLIRRRGALLGRDEDAFTIITHLCEGAFAALKAGDLDRHDGLVREGLRTLLPQVDVMVLAQASMARVADALDPAETGGTPILSSPRLGMERVAARLGRLTHSASGATDAD
jgi:Asp/Glu/hydantoin racemase